MDKHHKIEDLHFNGGRQISVKVDGKQYSFALTDISKRLLNATAHQRNTFVISPSGYGIHWPLLDEDISVDGLIAVSHKSKHLHAAQRN